MTKNQDAMDEVERAAMKYAESTYCGQEFIDAANRDFKAGAQYGFERGVRAAAKKISEMVDDSDLIVEDILKLLEPSSEKREGK